MKHQKTIPHHEKDLVLIGEFGRAQGLQGDIRLKSFTEEPEQIAAYSPLLSSTGKPLNLYNLRFAPGRARDIFLVRIEGIENRNEAEQLTNTKIYTLRDSLAVSDDEDEFLLIDLIGLNAFDENGEKIGTVTAVPNYGGGDLIEIRLDDQTETVLLPFTRQFIPEIDIPKGRLVAVLDDELDEEPLADDA